MKSNLDLKITGIRGGDPTWNENKGAVKVFIDNESDFITVDAFQGRGDDYQRREQCEIQVVFDGKEWKGTKAQLAEMLFSVQVAIDKKATIETLIDKLNEAGITVDNYEENEVLCGYELNTYTDGGVNQIIFLDFRDSKLDPTNAEDFLTAYDEYVSNIDIDDEIFLNRQDPRYKAAFKMKDSVEDFEAWKLKLESIFKSEFLNQDLNRDKENFVLNGDFDKKPQISKTKDKVLTYPYIIDVEDKSYFYASKEERNTDYEALENWLNKNY